MNLRRKTVVTVISRIGEKKPKADACLVVIYGQNLGHRFALKPGEVMIGRSSNAHIQIDHESVSRKHARLTFQDAQVSVEDLGSTNGTYVNDEPITARILRDGDLIKVGRTILKYLSNNNIESAYHEEIYRLTTIDGLTRCANRRYFTEQLVREVSRAKRYSRPLSVVCFDIGGFKDINEEFGHLAGDAVLAQIGNRIRRRIRREDVLARYGGGEFAIIAPELDEHGANDLATRMSQIIAEGAFGFDDVQIPVNIRVAGATLTEINEDDVLANFSDGDTVETRAQEHLRSATLESDLSTAADIHLDKFALLADHLVSTARERMTNG